MGLLGNKQQIDIQSLNTAENVSGDVNIPNIFTTYHGVETNSATVAIDNTNRAISVVVKPISGECINDILVDGESVVYDRVAEITIQPAIDTAIAAEETRAKRVENNLQANINLSNTKIVEETAARIAADSGLNSAIVSEAATARAAEQALGKSITDLSSEINGRLDEMTEDYLKKLFYCNVRLTDLVITKINDQTTNIIEKGGLIQNITISVNYNKLPVDCDLSIFGRTYPPLDTNKNPITSFRIPDLSSTSSLEVPVVLTSRNDGSTSSKSVMALVANRIYFGIAEENWALTDLDSKLSESFLSDIPLEAAENKYIYYICPKSYGIPMFTLSPAQFRGGVSFIETIRIADVSGHKEDYDVWRSDNPGLGNITLIVEKQ